MPADNTRTKELLIQLVEPDAEQQLERDTEAMRRDIEDLGTDVSQPAEDSVPGGRGVDLVVLGALLVSLQPTIELVTAIVELVGQWRLSRAATRSVRVTVGNRTIEIDGATDKDVKRVFELLGKNG